LILEGLPSTAYFSFELYAERLQLTKYSFVLQKGDKIKIKMIPEFFQHYLYKSLSIIHRIKLIFRGLAPTASFSLVYYAERVENIKIQFWITKRGQNQNQHDF